MLAKLRILAAHRGLGSRMCDDVFVCPLERIGRLSMHPHRMQSGNYNTTRTHTAHLSFNSFEYF